ncbi:DNA-binding phage protein [Bradyrhizobium sp. USDA 4472]
MYSTTRFRIALTTLGLVLGCYGLCSLAAELSAMQRPQFPSDPGKIVAPAGEVPGWLEAAALVRSDLQSSQALIAALQTIQRGKAANSAASHNASSRSLVKQALSSAPYDAELWLALALLESQHEPGGPTMLEALKMAYFTAPNDARLMPVRLDTATLFDVLVDPDLAELARGDVRLMLTRQADLKMAVVRAYRRASKQGKEFLDQAVKAIDPSFIAALHS